MSDPVSSESSCPTCGAPLDPTILDGSCSACMWSDIILGEQTERTQIADTPEIQGYEILEEIGHGGMGVVYRAKQTSTAREVALKIVAPYSLRAAQARERFMVEVDAMAAVQHPALLPLFDAGEDDYGRPWLTMQLAQGGTLSDRREEYDTNWRKISQLLVTLCQAVHYAHERGILHRDLKPPNILFDIENNPYIADFGLAKWSSDDSDITRSTHVLGSPAYLAPEAAASGSKVTTTSGDVYGLGAIFYELLCGERPYQASSATHILTKIVNGPPPAPRQRRKTIPRDLEVIALKAMAHDPTKRYHSTAAFADDLNRWLEGRPIQARPVGYTERIYNWARRNPSLATLSSLLMGSLVIGSFLLWRANQQLSDALEEAEAHLDFMTRELPIALEPIGQLDVLDSVFEKIAPHYEEDQCQTSESLARHADFLTNRSKVHRPQGQLTQSLQYLHLAVEKGNLAISDHTPSPRAWIARIYAGQQLGETLILNKEFSEAHKHLVKNTELLDKLSLSDPQLEVLSAQNELILAKLEGDRHQINEAIQHGERALAQWDKLVPKLEENIKEPWNQSALLKAAETYYELGSFYANLKDRERASQVAKEGFHLAEKLCLSNAKNTHFTYHLRHFQSQVTLWEDIPIDEKKKRFITIERDISRLTENDPSNIEWINVNISNAIRLAEISDRMGDFNEKLHWLNLAATRLKTVYYLEGTNSHFIQKQLNYGNFLAERLEESNWPATREIHQGMILLQLRLVSLKQDASSKEHLNFMIEECAKIVANNDGTRAAEIWKNKIERHCQTMNISLTN